MTDKQPKGIRRRATHAEVFAKVNGKFLSRHYPLTYSDAQLRERREHLIAVAKHGAPDDEATTPAARTFEGDVTAYLKLVALMPTYKDRAYRIGQWVDVFRGRARDTITAEEIGLQLERWRSQHQWSVAYLNQFRVALMSFYTRLNGESGYNPVRDVPHYDERSSVQVRALDMLTLMQVIRRMSPHGKGRVICRALLWTGLPGELFKQIRAEDVNFKTGTLYVHKREKGRGMAAATIALVPRYVPGARRPRFPSAHALRRLIAIGGLGYYSNSSLHSRVADAVERENAIRRAKGCTDLVPPVNPYMFRHSFGTWLAPQIKDDRALMEIMRTKSIERYTVGSVPARVADAIAKLGRSWHIVRPTEKAK